MANRQLLRMADVADYWLFCFERGWRSVPASGVWEVMCMWRGDKRLIVHTTARVTEFYSVHGYAEYEAKEFYKLRNAFVKCTYVPLKNQTFSGEIDFAVAVSLAASYRVAMETAESLEDGRPADAERYVKDADVYANRLAWMADCFLADVPRSEL